MEPITFGQFDLDISGNISGGATALQWGPDGLLYAVGRQGFVYAIEVEKQTDASGDTTGYTGVIKWTHDLSAPNFNDAGEFENNGNRQALGIVVTEDDITGETVVYASHSDIKIGAGGGGGSGDVGLDTNSGVVTRIKLSVDASKNVTENESIDLIRGLPRSEENHATNGLALTTNDDGDPILLIASGGHANAGAPSVNFVGLPEYTYSAAILSADLNQLATIETAKKSADPNIDHVFDMPTLDDPTRPNFTDANGDVKIDANFDGVEDSVAEFVDEDGDDIPDWMVDQDGDLDVDADDVADFVATKIVDTNGDGFRDTILYQEGGSAEDNVTGVRGGNDALNQAKLLVGNPVQIYSSGYRNTYDVLVTEDGRKYTYDNGANGGWGGVAVNDNGTVTNEPNNVNQTQNFDQLHEFDQGTHSGHPNPTHASGSDAGLWTSPTTGPNSSTTLPIGQWRQLSDTPLPNIGQQDDGLVLPADWDEVVDAALIDPATGVYNEGGTVADGALDSDKGSWNGMAEYTGTAFGGQLQGALLVTKTGGDVKWIKRDINGNVEIVGANNGGDLSNPNTIVEAANQGTVGVTGKGNTLGIDAVGDDGVDGLGKFTNTIWVGSLGGSDKITIFEAGGEPAGADLDKDDDGIDHIDDYYEFSAVQGVGHVLDPQGTTTTLNAGETRTYNLSAESYALSAPGGIGQLGYMVNGVDPSAEGGLLTSAESIIPGGAGGALQIKDIRSGTAEGTGNDQREALTFAVSPGGDAGRIEISTLMGSISTGFFEDGSEAGLQFGTGDQFSYMSLVLAYSDSGTPALSVDLHYEDGDSQVATQSVNVPGLLEDIGGGLQGLPSSTVVEFLFDVDIVSGLVTPKFRIATDGDVASASFTDLTPVQAQGNVLDAMQGNFTVNGEPHPLAFGNIGTSAIDPATPAQPVEDDNVSVTYDEFKVVGFAPQVDAFVVLTGADASVTEDVGTLTLTLELQDEFGAAVTLAEDVEVAYTLAGDAQVPDDATIAPASPVTITSGSSSATVTITIDDDDLVEGTETLEVALGTIFANGLAVLAKAGSDAGTVTITDNDVPDPGSVLYRVNAGTATDAISVDAGPNWLGDVNLVGPNPTGITVSGNTGDTFSNGLTDSDAEMDLTNLVSPVPWQLFVNERGDNAVAAPTLDYAFDVTPGASYTVTLYYVENWNNIFTNPNRIFDVSLEGTVPAEFDNIHPLREATDYVDGPGAPLPSGTLTDAEKQPYLGTAFSQSVTYTATDDELNLSFLHESQNPKINAIEISVADPGTGGSVAVVSVADVTVDEGDGTATVTFSLSAPVTEGTVTVPFTVTNGSAEAGSDFTAPTTLEVVFDGSQTATATFAITDDPDVEGVEDFSVAIDAGNIVAPTEATVTASGTAGSATVTINDNDVAPPVDGEVLYRVNAGGPTIVVGADDATNPSDPDLDWSADTGVSGPYLISAGSDNVSGYSVTPGPSVPATVPAELFQTERWDGATDPSMQWGFVVADGTYVVNLYMGNGFPGTSAAGARVFDVAIEGAVPSNLDDIDLSGQLGHQVGGLFSHTVEVTDGQLDIEFLHNVENPLINGIEIVATDADPTQDVTITAQDIAANESTGEITITFTLSEAVTGGDITVPFTLVSGTADVATDLTTPSQDGSITFTAGGVLTQTTVITLVNDELVEADETFTVELGAPTSVPANVNVTTVNGTATIINDDVAPTVDSFNGTAATGDDWSNDNTAPDDVTLNEGTNTLVSTGASGDADYITFTVAAGQQVTAITLSDYAGGGNSAFLGIQQGESVPTQADIEGGSATLDGGTVYNVAQLGANILPLLASTSVENAGQPTNGLTTPLEAGTYTLWFNQNQDLTETTLEIVSEAVPGVDPNDIDGDGILNTDDPFAYDGTNGDAKVLSAGNVFRQDFNTDTTDPFSAAGGFSGIIVNPAFDPAGASETDPYGDRTTESGVVIEDGALKVTSSETDLFSTGTPGSEGNQIKDNYQSAVDVTGVDSFSVEGKVQGGWLGTAPGSFASFGITLGAGGTDDYIKLVLGGQNANVRFQMGQENSLDGVKEENTNVNAALIPDIASAIFRLDVDKSGATPTLTGTVILLDSAEQELDTLTTATRTITGSLAAALEGNNPLTGGDGGVAYGISITDWGGAAQFTGEWDYLEVRGPSVPDAAPTAVTLDNVVSLPEGTDTTAAVKVADIVVVDDGVSAVTLSLGGADAAKFDIVGDELVLKAGETLDFEAQSSFDVTVTATDGVGSVTSAPLGALVTDVNDAPTISGTLGDQTATAGTPSTVDVSAITVADEDVGDTPTLEARLQNGDPLPAGLTLNGTSLEIADTLAAGDYAIEFFGDDTQAESVSTVPFTLTVEPAAPTTFTTTLQAGELTIVDADGDSTVRTPLNPEDNQTGTGKENGIWINSVDDEYLDLGGDNGDGAEFTYNALNAATGTLTFRYANGGGADRPMTVVVNGVEQGIVPFSPTPEWFEWEEVSIEIDLAVGANVVSFSQNQGAGPNIDQIVLVTEAEPAADNPPAFDIAPTAVSVQENTTDVVADFDATDPDGTPVTFSLAGDDVDDFTIDASTGELSFDPAPDFEAPTDTGNDNVYNVDVVASSGGVSVSSAIEVTVEDLPSINSGNVTDGDTDIDLQPSFTFNFAFVDGVGVDELTITPATVKLIEVGTGDEVPSTVNGSGGNDALAITPLEPLDPNTDYQIVVDGVLDLDGRPLEVFTANFTTGGDGGPVDPLEPAFIVNSEATIENVPVTSLEISPDGAHLYAASVVGTLYRWDIDPTDGTLSNQTTYAGLDGKAVIGIAFDPNSPNDLWLTSNLPVGDEPDFTGEIVRLTLDDTTAAFDGTLTTMVTGLPRSVSDHLSNSIEFNAAGEMFMVQGSNTASGAADNVWGNRDERLLSAATLKVDHVAIAALVDGGAPAYDVTTDVQDFDGGQGGEQATPADQRNADGSVPGFYNPFEAGALVTVHASGIRNAYDLVWHSNGFLYVPTNGTGSQGNVPDDPSTAFDESTVASGSPKPDLLFKSDADGGEYFGHPNPTRGEYIAFGGNPTAGSDPQQINNYPVGTSPDENFTEATFDFGNGKSPNGSVEFTSDVFNGALKGALLTTRFSGGDDIFAFTFDENGDVASQTVLKDPDGNDIKFSNPLDVVTDATGRVYVIEYQRGDPFASSIKLLTPDAPPVATAEIELGGLTEVATDDRIVFSAVDTVEAGTATADIANVATVTVSNPGTEDLVVSSIGVTGEFELANAGQASGFTVAPGSSVDVTINFTADSKGVFTGELTINSNDADEGTKTVTLAGYNQPVLEGGQEPNVNEILQVFGYTTDLGNLANRDGDDGAAGDEVISAYWEAAGSGAVTVTQLAAYTGQRDYEIQWFDENPLATDASDLTVNPIFAHALSDSHTLLPDSTENDGPARDPATGSFTPTGPFGFSIFWDGDTDYTDPAFQTQDKGATGNEALPGGDILMRMFALRDADGNVVPNKYLLFQDYQAVNFDWNDNVYLVENVAPAETAADAAPTAQVVVTDPADANSDLVVTATFSDDNAIDDTTVAEADLTLVGPGTPSAVTFAYDAATDTATWTYAAPAEGWADGDYTATLGADSVSDDAGQGVAETAASTALDFTPIVPGELIAAINVGGTSDYTRSDGTVFVADPGPSSEVFESVQRTGTRENLDVDGTEDDDLYRDYRFSSLSQEGPNAQGDAFTYSIVVPQDGSYAVTVYAAEIFQTAVGARVFDILAEGSVVVDDLDLVAQFGPVVGGTSGSTTAGVLEFDVEVTDGTLDLTFADDLANHALVSAIEVRAAADPNTAPEFITAGEFTFLDSGGAVFSFDVEATDAEGEDITYTLSGADLAAFAIDESTGEVTFTPDAFAALDPPGTDTTVDQVSDTYTITVTADDGTDTTDQEITVDFLKDTDADGVADVDDNAIFVANADQLDTDADGKGDVLAPDINEDGLVSLPDFSILSATFNLAEGDPGYDARADINYSGGVSITDFSALAARFNTALPQLSANDLLDGVSPLALMSFGFPASFAAFPMASAADADVSRFVLDVDTDTAGVQSLAEVAVGDTFSVQVLFETGDTQSIDGLEFHLDFDPAVLNVTAVTPDTMALPVSLVPAAFDNTAGTIDYAAGAFSNFPQGDQTFATIEFEVVGAGSADITFADVFPRATEATFGGESILDEVLGAEVTASAVDVAPTSVTLANVAALPENTDTTNPVKVADIVVVDDGVSPVVLTVSDETNFEIVGSELFLKAGAALDFEAQSSFDVTVTATDAVGSADANATVAIGDVNEFAISAVSDDDGVANEVAEDAVNGTAVGITALATDADGTLNGVSYALTDDADGRFAIDANSGVVTVADATQIDFEADESHTITVEATSDDGSVSTENFTVNIADVDEFAISDVSDSDDADNEVAEDAVNGTAVGITALATDADVAQNVSYALTDDANGRFAIDANSGVVTVADATQIDFEADESHTITVEATSDDGSTSTEDFTVAIGDVNEFAISAVSDDDGAANEVAEDAVDGTAVGITALATDADGTLNGVSYALTDDADGRFAIDANSGVVTVADATQIDFEADESHTITVEATSEDGSVSTEDFTVAVTDVVEDLPGDSRFVLDVDTDTAGVQSLAEVTVGDTFSVQVLFETGDTQSIDGLEFHLDFDPAVLNVTAVTPDTMALPVSLVPAAFDNTAGTIDYAAGAFSNFPQGDQTFATIEFEVVGAGSADITFADVFPRATQATFGGESILDEVLGAEVTASAVDVAPTSVTLANVAALPENTDTTNPVKVADIEVVDDGVSAVTLSLGGADAAKFDISGGDLVLKAGETLDFEAQSSFDVTVTATDVAGSVTSGSLGALVTDVNEAPVLSGTLTDQTVTAGDALDVSAITATDPDAGDTATLLVRAQSGDAAPAGVTLLNGQIFVAASVAAGDYQLEIVAEDTSQAESATTAPFTLTVEPAEETFSGAYQPNANGDFVFEAENETGRFSLGGNDWDVNTTDDLPDGHEAPSNGEYIEANSNHFGSPGGSVFTYDFVPDTDGFVRVNLIASRNPGGNSTEHNDSWTGIQVDGVTIEALDQSVPLQPKGGLGLYKTYSSGGSGDAFIVANKNVDNNGQPIVIPVEAGKLHQFLLSERSAGHEVDKIVLEFFETAPGGLNNNAGNLKSQPLSIQVPIGAEISGRVFADANGDNVDNGEPGIDGVIVELLDVNGVVAVATTGGGGSYAFSDLADGTYSVRFPTAFEGDPLVATDAGGNDAVDSDADQTTGETAQITVTAGDVIDTVDAGYDREVTLFGSAFLTINDGANGIESSNFGAGSFQITNTGEKQITAIEIDVTDALFPDAVFDPFDVAGDTTGKELQINSEGGTGVVIPLGLSNFDSLALEDVTYFGEGGNKGYEKIRIEFNDFDPGETIGFSIDMDPNSIAGAAKSTLDSGAPLAGAGVWDVGGIGGAELAGSLFNVEYIDESTSSGKLQGQGTGQQIGAEALSTQNGENLSVTLTVNGLGEGAEGSYATGGPTILIQGPDGEMARVLVAKGFIVPFTNEFTNAYEATLDAQLQALEATGFPANNAVELLYVEVELNGSVQDISSLFDFSQVVGFDLSVPDQTNEFGVLEEDKLPLGIVASVIDETTGEQKGPVTSPIHLVHSDTVSDIVLAPVTAELVETGDDGTTTALEVSATATSEGAGTYDAVLTIGGIEVDVQEVTLSEGQTQFTLNAPNDSIDNGTDLATVTLRETGGGAAVPATPAVFSITEDDGPVEGATLLRINSFGPELTATDGGPNWLADPTGAPIEYFSSIQDRGDVIAAGDVQRDGDLPGYVPSELFELTRSSDGTINYDIPLTDLGAAGIEGSYKINLYFAEGFFAGGGRVFDILVEDSIVFDNFDVSANFGVDTGGVVSTTVDVTDGELNLDFLTGANSGAGGVQNPIISGIEIIEFVDEVTPTADLSLTKTVTEINPDFGDQITFTVTVTNDGPETSEDVEITNFLGNGYLVDSTGQSAGTYDLGTSVWTVGTLAVGESQTLTVTATVQGDAGTSLDYTATAEITAASEIDPDSTVNNGVIGEDDDATVVVTPIAGGLNEVTIAATDADAAEPADDASFTVSLDEAADTPTVVSYTVTGTATPGADYIALSGSVTILAGDLSAPIDLSVLDDMDVEDPETVTVTLDAATGDANLAVGAANTATATITSEDLPPIEGSAKIEITPNGGLGATTFGGSDKIQITNSGPADIKSITIDFSTGILPDMVWDPTGSGGDATAQAFTPGGTAAIVGLVAPTNPGPSVGEDDADPFSNPRNGGWDAITLNFTDFNQGEFFSFTSDVDPNSIQGIPNAGFSGAVSGYELIGSTITVTFTDGTSDQTVVSSLYEDGSLGGGQSEAVIATNTTLAAPTIELLGAGADESSLPGDQHSVPTGDTVQTVRVTGEVGANVSLLQMDARLFINGGVAPFDVSADELPFYANEATSGKTLYEAVIGAGGFVDIDVTLLATPAGGSGDDGGLNHFIAVLSDEAYAVDTATSQTSNTLIIKEADNTAPEITSADTFELVEGDDTLVFTPTAQDADGDPIDFELTGTDAAAFFFDETTGEVTYVGTPVFGAGEVTQDLTFDLTASDGNLSDTQTVTVTLLKDSDGDLVGDRDDNATNVANPNQIDSDQDGFGNVIDADFNGDGAVNLSDLTLFAMGFGTTTPVDPADPASGSIYDLNVDGAVNLGDLTIYAQLFGQPVDVGADLL